MEISTTKVHINLGAFSIQCHLKVSEIHVRMILFQNSEIVTIIKLHNARNKLDEIVTNR